MSVNVKSQLEVLSRGVAELISWQELQSKLAEGRPLRVKLGVDPTTADLHLGHTVVLEKLRQFQELGHQIIFLLGDYTAQVGDPSGWTKTRPALSETQVKENSKTYLDQAYKILDRKATEVRKNSEWLGRISSRDLLTLTRHYNVARMLEREDFRKRYGEGQQITIQEFIYPLLQGYDSVVLKADVELGGLDQKFNLVVARDVQRAYGREPEVICMMPLLVGVDGQKKMSKSYGNQIGVTEPPPQMFGKLMSVSDEMMWHYYELLSRCDEGEVKARREGHPKEAKKKLALEIVTRFWGREAANEASDEFEKIFAKKECPERMEEKRIKGCGDKISLVDLLAECNLAPSKSEARRLIRQGAISVDGVKNKVVDTSLAGGKDYVVQVGKRHFLKVSLLS